MFSEPAYNTIGDEYDKKIPVSDRVRGGQFKTSPSKKGGTNDVFFDKKFKSLSEGDKYIDPGTIEKRDRMESSKKKLTPEGFKYTNPSKKSAGLGNYFGTFQERTPYKHETEFVVLKKGEQPDKSHQQPKNITTGPGKKGTYGTMGTTIGHGDEYKYISDPYDSQRRKDVQDTKDHLKKQIGPPFRAACKRAEFFDGQANVAASKVYGLDRALPASKPQKPPPEPKITVPFKPSSPPRKGFNATLSKAPEYKEDPYEAKEKAERDARQKNKASVVWKPVSSGGKTLPTRSIAFSKSV